MRTLSFAMTGLVLCAVGPASTASAADEEYRHGYVRYVEPGVTLQRATEVGAEEAVPNLPFLPGDRVWTDGTGRADFRFPDGSAVRLDSQSKLDYGGHDEGRDEAIVLRLWSGSLIVRNRTGSLAAFEIETPGGLVRVTDRGVFRIDVGAGETRVSAYEGWTSLDTGRDRVEVGPGERAWAQWGGSASGPEGFDRYAGDEFARWDGDLESRASWAASGRRYLPEELQPYAGELDGAGTWAYESSAGYVWRPYVGATAGWTPYSNGYWAWTPVYGYSWVAYEPWGWAPFHYGRWGFSGSLGWYWSPGRVWGPGWVSWWVGGGHVGWCPLGRHGRPVTPWDRHHGHGSGSRGYAVPRGSIGHSDGWSVVRSDDLGRRDVARRRVAADAKTLGSVRLAETGRERPDRRGLALAEATSVPASAFRRPRAGSSGTARTLPVGPGAVGGTSSRGRAPSSTAEGSSVGRGRAVPRFGDPTRTESAPPERRIPGMGSSRPRSTATPEAGTGRSGSRPSAPGIGSSRPRPGGSSNETSGRSDSDRRVPGVGSSRSRSTDTPSSGTPRTEPERRTSPRGSVFERDRRESSPSSWRSSTGSARSRGGDVRSSSPRSSGRSERAAPSRSRSGSSVRAPSRPSSSSTSRSRAGSASPSRPSSSRPSASGSSPSRGVSSSGSGASRSSSSGSSSSRSSSSGSSRRSRPRQ